MPDEEHSISFSMTDIIALIMVVGTIGIFPLLGFVHIPTENRDLFNVLLGVWATGGFAVVMKRLFDGTASSDTKNATIATMGAALAQATPTDPTKVAGQ